MAARGKSGVKITDTDKGYARLVERMHNIAGSKPSVVVGILEGVADRETDGVTVLDKGIWNEFGTKNKSGGWHTPPRSFIRGTVDEKRAEAGQLLAFYVRQIVAVKLDEETALGRFGAWFQGQIQKRIASGIDPDNAESTIARKGSSTPLINTGQLRSAITWAIRRR